LATTDWRRNMYLQKLVISALLLFTSINIFAKESLVFAVDIVRHGDRAPQLDIPKASHKWIEGPGQLTALGMRQTWQRGVFFREKYIRNYHLLPEHYQNGTMLVFSTDSDRTLVSAQAMLLGLYPSGTGPFLSEPHKPSLPDAFQPIPIRTRVVENKSPILTPADAEKYYQLIKKYVLLRPDWKEKTTALKNNFQKWNLATGLNISDIRQLQALADALHIYQIHNIATPPGLSKKDIEEIIAIGRWGSVTEHQTKEIANFFGQTMLSSIADYLQKASQQPGQLKYVLFSDHDTTIGCTMTLLQNPLDTPPPYVADLNFALLKTDAKDYLVRISYNDKEVFIPGCGKKTCTLKQFMEFIKTNSISSAQNSGANSILYS
jgi:lysosomal acid phosphatase